MNSGKGFDLLFLRNVCYDSESARVILFGDNVDKTELAKYFQSMTVSKSFIVELPREDFFAVVNGKYPKAAEIESISNIGSYLFLTDDSMDSISQFSSVHFIVHFIHNSLRYPSVSTFSLCFQNS